MCLQFRQPEKLGPWKRVHLLHLSRWNLRSDKGLTLRPWRPLGVRHVALTSGHLGWSGPLIGCRVIEAVLLRGCP